MKRRIPINYEPCQSGKTGHTRNPPPGPCETCVRRVYLRRSAQTLPEQNTTQVSNDELLARIQTLEDMLRGRNDGLSSHAAAPQGCLTPMTLGTNARRYQSHSSESTTVPTLSSLSPSARLGHSMFLKLDMCATTLVLPSGAQFLMNHL